MVDPSLVTLRLGPRPAGSHMSDFRPALLTGPQLPLCEGTSGLWSTASGQARGHAMDCVHRGSHVTVRRQGLFFCLPDRRGWWMWRHRLFSLFLP